MHPLVDSTRLQEFMRALGAEPGCAGRVYVTGGGSAVLVGWRAQTAVADLLVVPDTDPMLRAIQKLKLSLRMNVELASPAHFLPELPGWQDRSPFIAREGKVDFFHYDFYAQALSKILRGQEKAPLVPEAPAVEAPPAEATATAPVEGQKVEMSRMRQTIARRMAQSKREAPHYYVTVAVDMTEAQRMRSQLNATLGEEARISINDLLVKAVAKALAKQPMFNTWFVDGEIRRYEAQNVCIAIALEDGLIAPAILDCGRKSLVEIAQASRSLAERAKSGALKPEEYADGTFTISNLGMFGVEELIAIIQPPQTAILGVGMVSATPVARDGVVAIADVMKLALSGDHRVTDGAQGAQFLSEVKRLLESPIGLLV